MKIFNFMLYALSLFVPLTGALPMPHKHNSCSFQYIKQQDVIVKQKCCSNKVCNTAPKVCSKECAVVFMPFYHKCHRFFDHSFYNVHLSTAASNIRKLQEGRPQKGHTHTGHTHKGHPHTGHKGHHYKIPKSSCMDRWGSSCAILKRLNDCKSGKMSHAMKTGCAKTCGTCRPKSNVQIMAQNCRKIYNEEVLNKKDYKGTKIPITCSLWFDGCNRCGVNKGKLTFCTRMMCIRKQKAHCVKYKGISVVSKKPITKCDEIALSNALKGCETILKADMNGVNRKVNHRVNNRMTSKVTSKVTSSKVTSKMCQTPCVKNMVKFYNKCYNAPSLKNFFKNLNTAIIRPCEQGVYPVLPKHKIGGARDVHKCLLSAGYTWCGASNKCVRIWETPCPKK